MYFEVNPSQNKNSRNLCIFNRFAVRTRVGFAAIEKAEDPQMFSQGGLAVLKANRVNFKTNHEFIELVLSSAYFMPPLAQTEFKNRFGFKHMFLKICILLMRNFTFIAIHLMYSFATY